jgi:hypothetical protein
MELMMKNGTANLQTKGKKILPCGLRLDLNMVQPKEDKPIVYLIEYMVDPIALSEWLDSEEIQWMNWSGPMLFNVMGLRIMIPRRSERKSNDEVLWSIDTPTGTLHVHPIKNAVKFRVHREVLSKTEWECHLDELP